MKKYAIIVAGGSGRRMQPGMPKQFLILEGLPVLMHTMRVFYLTGTEVRLILVLPHDHTGTWRDLCLQHSFAIDHLVVEGGETRFHSVKNGLEKTEGDSLVAVHDGVRPLVAPRVIENAFTIAGSRGTAIPAVPVNESVHMQDKNSSRSIDRKNVRIVQTPQVFRSSILKKAYEQEYRGEFTDDASVVEAAGFAIHLIEGNVENIKITRKIDLDIAASLMG